MLRLYCNVLVLMFLESKRKITRRHSLHSPSGDFRPMLRLLSSTHSKSLTRPTSMHLDLDDDIRSDPVIAGHNANDQLSSTLKVPVSDCTSTRPRSNQNLAKNSSPNFLSTAPHCGPCTAPQALSTSPLHSAPSTLNSASSMSSSFCLSRPTLMTQISCASSSVAESPSPVERDGLMSMRSVATSEYSVNSNSKCLLKGGDFKSLDLSNRICPEPRRKDHHSLNDSSSLTVQGSKLLRTVSKATPFCSNSPNLLLRKQPHHSHSNPEFPLTMAHISVNQAERTHSYDDLYATRRKPPFHHPTSEVSLSREKINSLSSHICSSLDQCLPTSLSYETGSSYSQLLDVSSPSPVCEVMQKVINVTTPLLNFNKAHIRTLMNSYSNSHLENDHFPKCSHMSITTNDSSYAEMDDEFLSQKLSRLGYKIINKPLDIACGVPQSGFVTLLFKIIGQDVQMRDAFLKVSTLSLATLQNKVLRVYLLQMMIQ